VGKTQFVRTFLTQVLGLNVKIITNKEDLKSLDPSIHQILLFDDYPHDTTSREEGLYLYDSETDHGTIAVKYGAVNVGGYLKFIISNRPLEDYGERFADSAIQNRILVYILPKDISLIRSEGSPAQD
jgi:hypothetical protein